MATLAPMDHFTVIPPSCSIFGRKKKPRTRGSAQEGGHHLSFEMDDSSIGRKSISKLLNNVKVTSLVVSSNVNRKRAFLLKTCMQDTFARATHSA